jgi:CPA2 family monovalent cation:H+ antiporter-2
MIGASRAQIGEFSFILAGLAVTLGLLPPLGRDLVLAGALISILLTPFFFEAADWIYAHHEPPKKAVAEAASTAAAAAAGAASPAPDREPAAPSTPAEAERPTREPVHTTRLSNHVVLVGYGRVGSVIGAELRKAQIPLLVFESDDDIIEALHKQNIEAIGGNAADPDMAAAANYAAARCLLVAIPDGFEGGQVVEQARLINAHLPIIARAHSEEEIEHLRRHGASKVVMGEFLIAQAMIADAHDAGVVVPVTSAPPVTPSSPG